MLKVFKEFIKKGNVDEMAASHPPPPEPSNEEKLLTEIRDLLKK